MSVFDVLLFTSGSVNEAPTGLNPIGLFGNESPTSHRSFSRTSGRTTIQVFVLLIVEGFRDLRKLSDASFLTS